MSIFIELAQVTVGISTPHYLYLNEATHSLIETGSAAAAAEALEAIDGHREAVEECGLPACEKPEALLLHLSQSNAYHRRLVLDVRLSIQVFHTYHALSGVPYHERLADDPRPMLQSQLYDPATYNPARGIAALWNTMDCLDAWSNLPAQEKAFENIMDLLQPPLHLLVGGLMTHLAMMEELRDGHLKAGAAVDWFKLMEHGVFYMIRHSSDYVAPKIHDLWSEAAIAATAAEAVPMAVIDEQEIEEMLMVLMGLDKGLETLSENLLSLTGIPANKLGRQAAELRESIVLPFISHLVESSGLPPTPDGIS